MPKDVYRRHDYCRCVVEYDPGDGGRQNVHTKRWTEPEEAIEKRKVVEGVNTASKIRTAPPQIGPENVTTEYYRTATPGMGKIAFDEGYDFERHEEELKTAQWLHENLGGDIVLLNESTLRGIKTPDYIWREKFWELKGVSSVNSADQALRYALKQIREQPGGVILNLHSNQIDGDSLYKQLYRRFLRGEVESLDVLVLNGDKMLKVLRYKK